MNPAVTIRLKSNPGLGTIVFYSHAWCNSIFHFSIEHPSPFVAVLNMPLIQFPKLPSGSFKDAEEEKDYLYNLLNFTLRLDAIEDDNPHLISFVKNLLKLLTPLLEVDELRPSGRSV